MNEHLNVFLNYKENEGEKPKENNLTRAFIITLKNEPQLLRDLFFILDGNYSWDEISVSIQTKNLDISGFENIIGLALTSEEIDQESVDLIKAKGNASPIPDFLIYNSKTLIVGEVKKHNENAIAQLKNQVECFNLPKGVVVKYKSLSWTSILSKLIIPHLTFNHKNESRTIWATEFKDYIATHYSDWLPVPALDSISFTDKESLTFQFIQKRLYSIQGKSKFGPPEWIGNRMTMAVDFQWATEVLIRPEKFNGKNYIGIIIWPADTKAQGFKIFYKNLNWVHQNKLSTTFGNFDLVIIPYIKFAHVMGKYIGSIEFRANQNVQDFGKKFHTKENFEKICGMWYRDQWPALIQILDANFKDHLDWKSEVNWEENFEASGRNYVFISMGFECQTLIPFSKLQDLEKKDPSGELAANLMDDAINKFQILLNS